MENDRINLFHRRDTFFGICEALAQDFGFNPLWLRLALVAPLFFFPVQTIAAYFLLGLFVLVSRRLYPADAVPSQTPAIAIVADAVDPADEPAEPLAIAA